ncbi:MAG: tRNA guanosine(34) transglycosylase Tgt [bacterium]|nr:tRNA guanosine(34) transglycosylase Tgt [bacterium]
MRFEVEKKDGNARAGILETSRSKIETPAYMPCATIGAVKGVRWSELEELDFRIVLMNSLHLYLRPGADVVRELGQIHAFSTWRRSILTDSGGYQFFSLKGLYDIDDEGVSFQSPYDGSRHRFTPESVVELQIGLGSDIIMPLDHCAPGDASRDVVVEAGERTLNWLFKAASRYRDSVRDSQALFGIIQGGTHIDLRQEYVNKSAELNLDGYALGGISVGEDRDEGDQIVHEITPLMPHDKPRYLMGVGLPGQILDGIESGIDLFDCVLPTRMARNGTLFTSRGRLNLRNSRFISEHEPLDIECSCATCRKYSRAYLSHLHKVGEPGVLGLLSLHNLAYYRKLVSEARMAIKDKNFTSWKKETIGRWGEGV